MLYFREAGDGLLKLGSGVKEPLAETFAAVSLKQVTHHPGLSFLLC